MSEYLAVTEIIDWQDPDILQLAQSLTTTDTNLTAKACFEWVRDHIAHSSDYQMNPVTCSASSVLHHKTGYCFAKSHLLAALLRANSIPTGFCYQRLSVFDERPPKGFSSCSLLETNKTALLHRAADTKAIRFAACGKGMRDNGAPYSLHGFNAVYLPEFGWYRLDARGNKPGVDAQFNPPQEQLAFKINFSAEIDCLHVFAEPLPQVIQTLQTYQTWDEVLHNLPDIERDYLASFNQRISVSK